MSLDLLESTKSIIQLAEDVSHKKFQFIEKRDMDYFARVKPARKHMASHLVYFKTEHNELINHLSPMSADISSGCFLCRRKKDWSRKQMMI